MNDGHSNWECYTDMETLATDATLSSIAKQDELFPDILREKHGGYMPLGAGRLLIMFEVESADQAEAEAKSRVVIDTVLEKLGLLDQVTSYEVKLRSLGSTAVRQDLPKNVLPFRRKHR